MNGDIWEDYEGKVIIGDRCCYGKFLCDGRFARCKYRVVSDNLCAEHIGTRRLQSMEQNPENWA